MRSIKKVKRVFSVIVMITKLLTKGLFSASEVF